MKAAIISLQSESSQRIAKAMQGYFHDLDNINLKDIEVRMGEKGFQVLQQGKTLRSYDCIFVRGSFRYLSLMRAIVTAYYKKAYTPLMPSSYTLAHDKILTHLKLQQANIRTPTTYLAATVELAKKILIRAHYPVIMKFPHGTGGKGVMVAESYATASSILDALTALNQPFLIQEYVDTSGSDIRAIVVGDKVVASMKRKAASREERANVHSGGKGVFYNPDTDIRKLAVQAAKAINAEIAAIDLLESAKGPLVIEVNASPGLQGIEAVTKIDIAEIMAKHIYERTKSITEKQQGKSTKLFDELGIGMEEKHGLDMALQLDFRGERILLPEMITNVTKFHAKDHISFKASKGKLFMERII
ncbi:RimK family alpha-L-glutamate ligase [Candidatus Woesearchaeota archaeon]|nr:RimK family alpha-L-glutamate ligase [Candidatus Woesearchaeota archaeon]